MAPEKVEFGEIGNTMPDEPTVETLISESVPEDKREALKTLIAEETAALSGKAESDLSALRSSEQGKLEASQKEVKDLKLAAARAKDTGGSSNSTSELGENEKTLQASFDREEAETKSKSELKASQTETSELKKTLFERDKATAVSNGLPQALADIAKDSSRLEELTIMHNAVSGNGAGKGSGNTTATIRGGASGNAAKTPIDVAAREIENAATARGKGGTL